ncbi:MAG TPA: glucose-6-phosphate dehydrogenase [Candidatus Andersenbacteria bacterium]|nr:glucose-6-phosphate dehydrogenase [Candidatus Andersenbacteria bacterium]
MQNISTLPTILTIFGATGDLTRRKLIPALFKLYSDGQLPEMMHIIGFARRPLSNEDFRSYVKTIILEDEPASSAGVDEFVAMISYCAGNFTEKDGYEALAKLLGKQDGDWHTCANKLFHLAVPPEYYEQILQQLAASGLTIPCGGDEGWTRVIVEKPFGKDLATAQALDELLGRLFKEEQVYRIDHYLGKDTVQNILAFRFSNVFLEPAWNARSIESIHINLYEALDVEGRGAFYDGVGALRDVGQNHMLQLLALFTMQNPGAFDADSILNARTAVLESLETMDAQDIVRYTMRGQYEGYRQENGVAQDSQTETYFQVEARLNLPQWRGVPIILRSGKAMHDSKVEVVVNFRHHTPCLCPPELGKHVTNILKYQVQPHESITTSFWAKKPGADMVVEEKAFSFDYEHAFSGSEFLDAYAKLLLDAIEGNQTSFVSTGEITASWRFIDPIIAAWEADSIPLITYPKKSDADAIIAREAKKNIPTKEIIYIGLGKMGSNMVERLLDYEWDVTAYDPNEDARKKVGDIGAKVVSVIPDLIGDPGEDVDSRLRGNDKKIIWLMVPHPVVDDVLKELAPNLREGDIVIDGGNSFYKDSIRRGEELKKLGVQYLDVGVSGGPSGARKGACLMIGGEKSAYKELVGLFSDLSIAGGYEYMGESGAGHFVKMVHNGIEYGMMQAIAEGFAVLKEWRGELDLEKIAHIYNAGSVIESRLIHWLKEAYRQYGADLQHISGSVAQSGEGKWTVDAAQELGIPVPIIQGALEFRLQSEDSPSYTGQILSALRNQFGGHDVKK